MPGIVSCERRRREIDINALDFVVLDEERATLRVTAVGYKPLEIPIVGIAGTTTIVSLPKMEAEPEQSRDDGSARETVGVLGAAGVVLGGSALVSWATAALFKRGVDEWACNPTCSSGWSNRKDDASSWQRYSLWTAAVSGGLSLTALVVAELMPSGRAPFSSGTSPSRSGGHHSFQLLPVVTPQTTGLRPSRHVLEAPTRRRRREGGRLMRHADVALATLVVAIVGMMIVPLPTPLLDVLLTLNISIGGDAAAHLALRASGAAARRSSRRCC